MICQHHYTNNFLGFSRGQLLRPVNRVVLPLLLLFGGTRTPFSSPFLRVVAHLEPKSALPY